MSESGDIVLCARAIVKRFESGDSELEILHGIDLDLRAGERLALMGPSGAGKSTLLHILGLLEHPTYGTVDLDGRDAWSLSTQERARLRNRYIGFVFQFYHLLSELDAVENVMLPAMIAQSRGEFRLDRRAHLAKARDLLSNFGLAHRLKHRPAQLSGGERQRVALARALFLDPPLLIADEPTGNLDRDTGELVLDLLFRAQQERNLSLLLVTHDERLAERCSRVLRLEAGSIVGAVSGRG
ncbi:MAG: ABC transporter ATP-binding protein [Planctomycetes bacterium]|nr:ABC transporter ATP-binding protein [Planctomycetota bacterium]